ncbi:MAG: bifunctional (p)ppGpp synthetase/guanosine-3',5'-bis(diphosphate) 3'-pyrophosphohydrolase [Bacillota bacterium]|nr:bifunctional (p)ppGpp synthetase/guanosine-3',5'-bis(diphosphate) 3'-pyrophosphohydrolase [Bacillota bacterium]
MAEPNVNCDEIFENLMKKVSAIYPPEDAMQVRRAYEFARDAHKDQKRLSGEPYICHPLEVACIIADFALDKDTVIAGLLHDVIEDTEITYEQVAKIFSPEIANMVEGVTKLGKIKFTTQEEEQVENLRKMFIATAKDVRIVLIKLCDRLHNMRTLDAMPSHKQLKKSLETIEVYAPIADRLGIFKVKAELEDLALKYLDPVAYNEITVQVAEKQNRNNDFVQFNVDKIVKKLDELNINVLSIGGRVKHNYSIFKKTFMQGRAIDEIYDIFAIRVIVETIADCYAVLGAVHELYRPIPGRIKDYISMAKANMYQSLHTTVIGSNGTPFEIQIRTMEMHYTAEYGIAAHWKYKQGLGGKNSDADEKLAWIRKIMEIQDESSDSSEFMRALKVDMFSDQVYVFTPKGDVVCLPTGSCPIDFAYSIHSAIGSKTMGAKVNGKLVPLNYTLNNGDIVSIITSTSVHGPSRDWLKIVKTSSARAKINQWFKKEGRDENIALGREMMDREIKKTGYTINRLMIPEVLEQILRKHHFQNMDDLYSAIGFGGIPALKIVQKLREEYKKRNSKTEEDDDNIRVSHKHGDNNGGVTVEGIDNCLVRLSRCCRPVPGDDIVGYITRGRGVSVHRRDCINVINNIEDEDRMVNVSWKKGNVSEKYCADLLIIADDRTGLLADIVNTLALLKIPTTNLNARRSKNLEAFITVGVEVSTANQVDLLINKLSQIRGVIKIARNSQ